MPKKPIDIALCFDEKFWAPAYAVMRSICLTSRRRTDLVFHLMHVGLSGAARADLEQITTEFGAEVRYYDVGADPHFRHLAATLEHSKQIPAVMYGRLLAGKLLPKTVKRLIYIDCDILVRAPIETLFDADLGGRPVGAVKDAHALVFVNRRDVVSDRDLLDPADPYFNSGLMLIDLVAWRKRDMVTTLERLEAEGILGRLYNDQQVLNYIFKRDWTQLDPSWNVFAASLAIEALDPKAVHYTGPVKPWNLINPVPFRRVYRHVMTNAVYYRYWRQRMVWKLTGGPAKSR